VGVGVGVWGLGVGAPPPNPQSPIPNPQSPIIIINYIPKISLKIIYNFFITFISKINF
jgi:hypothetical protein